MLKMTSSDFVFFTTVGWQRNDWLTCVPFWEPSKYKAFPSHIPPHPVNKGFFWGWKWIRAVQVSIKHCLMSTRLSKGIVSRTLGSWNHHLCRHFIRAGMTQRACMACGSQGCRTQFTTSELNNKKRLSKSALATQSFYQDQEKKTSGDHRCSSWEAAWRSAWTQCSIWLVW